MSKQEVEIRVSRWDILIGKRKSCRTCPVARAIRREFPDKHVAVEPSMVWGIGNPKVLPLDVKDFINNFDRSFKLTSLFRGGITFKL